MSIVKGNMVYSVEEFDDFWLVKYSLGGIQFSYRRSEEHTSELQSR